MQVRTGLNHERNYLGLWKAAKCQVKTNPHQNIQQNFYFWQLENNKNVGFRLGLFTNYRNFKLQKIQFYSYRAVAKH